MHTTKKNRIKILKVVVDVLNKTEKIYSIKNFYRRKKKGINEYGLTGKQKNKNKILNKIFKNYGEKYFE